MARSTIIRPDELRSLVANRDTRIVDCRFSLSDTDAGRRQFLESHIPGAVYAHLDEDLSDLAVGDPGEESGGASNDDLAEDASRGRHPLPSVRDMEEVFRRLGINNDDLVIAYDDSGGAIAARLWWMLQFLGHERAAVLDGGWQAWRAAGGAVSRSIIDPERGDFNARPGSMPVVDVRAILKALDDGTAVLLDARDAKRYTGEEEPIDPVAGHIPGAHSVPFKMNLDRSGRFLDHTTLRDRFEQFDRGEYAGVSYCGSGVTACHNILSMVHAGLRPAALYPASWSGWIADPERPLETGWPDER